MSGITLSGLVLQLTDGPTTSDIVLHCLVSYCIVWYCITLSGIALHLGAERGVRGGYCIQLCVIALSDFVLLCLALYYIVWHCITFWGYCIELSLYCLVLQLPDRTDQPSMCDIVLHVGVYCIELCVTVLSVTAAAGSLGSVYNV